MKVIAIGRITKPLTPEQRQQVFAKEVPDTLQRYLDGTIEQFWARTDQPGVVFLLNVASLDAAHAAIDQLPLVTGGFATYEYWPVGPLAPLGMLLTK